MLWTDQNSDFKCKLKSKITRPDIQIVGACYRGDTTEYTPE